jgi:heterotetrameric sarcosine oxidase delta subunit
MQIKCPFCGLRDRREFYYQGAALAMERPAIDAGEAAWDDYVHNRENPSGWHKELWQHEAGCGAWVVVERNLTTHEIRECIAADGSRP